MGNRFKELCVIEPSFASLEPIKYDVKEKFLSYLIKCEILRINIYLLGIGNPRLTKKDYDFLENYLIPKN